jgi:hypothetical protein
MAAAAGAKVACMFAKGDTGPGVVIIVEGESEAAIGMAAVAKAGGAVENMQFTRVFSQEDSHQVAAEDGGSSQGVFAAELIADIDP